ncbi:MAG: alpha/beta hydrolase [Desulfarculaceae bacterium]|nr:alpha/beta hydrolase [Desulfarculaceae bacterium]MCF8074147.1 alpha/beta hydrolase [Desulfarculaceae bacterium]MCF8103261.1 alpha/beta hydrolase [Desulfarculaceae bacterium]MCF8116881.1 alpha/beta hydrolase [Desulfarculaceae bacterium]
MPLLKVGDLEMYHEVHGQGFPLLLIMGLRRNAEWWHLQLPELSRHFQVIAFDNRGAGRSGKPAMDYSIPMFAADTAGLLDGLGVKQAHVVGVSMGGYIAQELALARPDLVAGLVLGCTSCGGDKAVRMDPEERAAFTNTKGLNPEQILQKDMHIYFSDAFVQDNPERIKKFVEISQLHYQPADAFLRQVDACNRHDTAGRVSGIKAPTLILTGDDDHLVPTENSRILHRLIPGSTLRMFPGGRHAFFMEFHREFNQAVLDFLTARGES